MNPYHLTSTNPRRIQARRRTPARRGNALIEMSLILVPLFGLLFGIIDFGFAIFLKSTMQHAVREGARYAVTYQTLAGECQDASITAKVQSSAMGFLDSHSDKIKIRYFEQDALTGAFAEVMAGGNDPGNIVEVSVEGYIHRWLVPIFWSSAPLNINVRSSDRMEGLPAGTNSPCRVPSP